jgi:hypothetical protein
VNNAASANATPSLIIASPDPSIQMLASTSSHLHVPAFQTFVGEDYTTTPHQVTNIGRPDCGRIESEECNAEDVMCRWASTKHVAALGQTHIHQKRQCNCLKMVHMMIISRMSFISLIVLYYHIPPTHHNYTYPIIIRNPASLISTSCYPPPSHPQQTHPS